MFINFNDITTIGNQIDSEIGDRTALLFIAENSSVSIDELIAELNKNDIPFLGGVFPKVIFDNQLHDTGIVVNYIDNVISSFVTHKLEQKQYTIPTQELSDHKTYCTFSIVDGLTGNISHYLSELYRTFGNYSVYLGGGAGSLTLKQQPCLFNNDGFYMNAAISIIYETKCSIGVKHGWKKIKGPIIATKTEKNVIQALNWRNAFEVYKEIIENDSKKEITSDNFFSISKGYPFGVIKENAECIVRDPIATNEKGELICVGEVLSNTVLDVLKGDEDNLIASAKEAANIAIKNATNPTSAIIVDCISRVLFLEDKFQEELDTVIDVLKYKKKELPISGALTLGEISSYNNYLELFNKTIVVGLFS